MSSRIGFDATDSEYSDDDRTVTGTPRRGNLSNRRPATPANNRRTRATPQSASTSRATRRSSSDDADSPQPGPSRLQRPSLRNTNQANTINRKQRKPQKIAVLREIWMLQQSTKLLIPKLPFCRVVREILLQRGGQEMRLQGLALEALQEATEMYMTQFMEDAYRCTLHRNQVTLKTSDMVLVRTLRGTQI